MTHAELVQRAARWLKGQGCAVVLTELVTMGDEQADALGFNARGDSILVECKASRADFRADTAKPFRRLPTRGMGAVRWFMAPPDRIREGDLPAGWGLLEVMPYGVTQRVKPVRFETYNHAAEIGLLVSAIRRTCPARSEGMSVKVFRWSSEAPRATMGICDSEAVPLVEAAL